MSFRCYSSQLNREKDVKAVNKCAEEQDIGSEESDNNALLLGLRGGFRHLSDMVHHGCSPRAAGAGWPASLYCHHATQRRLFGQSNSWMLETETGL